MTPSDNPKITKCRVCGNADLQPASDIGEQYLSSIFPDDLNYRVRLKKYPLDLVLCQKNNNPAYCGLLQLGHELDLSGMYAAYPYTSSSNSSMKAILSDVAQSGMALGHLKPGKVILDIGCNDGTLLSFFKGQGYQLLGIDAAQNIEPVFSSEDCQFWKGFFDRELFDAMSRDKASLIFSIAMFYHLADPVRFSQDVAACLADDGVWIIQMAYLPAMLATNMYDNIVHEHNGYYGIQTMQWVLEKAGLEVFDVLLNDVYGGSFRLFIKKKKNNKFPQTSRLQKNLGEEKSAGLFELKTYQDYDKRLQQTRTDLKSLLSKIKSENKKIWIYGASTKGNTIVQYCGLTNREIEAAADANPFKIGKYMIGCDIPIRSEEAMRRARPDYLLSLPYSFTDSFIKREQTLIEQGTKFIVPLPDVKVKP